MGLSEKTMINDFFNSFPREEIIKILSSIDTKISSLHTISSKDFLYFNKLLKQYYSNIKEISNANNVISLFINTDLPTIKNEIKDKNGMQLQLLGEAANNNNKIIDILTRVYSSTELLVVPVNNFKQNLITLKYILANLKLHLNYVKLVNGEELQKSILIIEGSIENIYKQIETVALKTESISKKIVKLKSDTCNNKDEDNSELKKELKSNFKRISFDDYLHENYVINLNTRTQKCFAYMGEVITNIQFHDIIRQKMEHIQTSQNDLIKELSSINQESANDESQLNLILKIPEITDIQVAQLLYTNKDYQTSIEKITNQLIEVSNEMIGLNTIYNSIHENTFKFEDNYITQITITQTAFEDFFEKLEKNWDNTISEGQQLKADYENFKSDYNSLFLNEKLLRQEVKNFEKLIRTNGEGFGNELMRRLKDLFSNLQINSNSLKTHLNKTTYDINSLTNIIDSFKPQSENYYISNDSIKSMTDKSLEIKQKTKEFASLSTNISDEITRSLKKIEYYSFFKTTVEEIVSSLNQINKTVNYDSLKDILGDNKEYLEKIEMLYTMKSERDIHEKLVGSDMSANEILNDQSSSSYDIDDNDIELF